jgi:hypothetical protein
VKHLSNAAFALTGVFLIAATALLPTVASTLAAGDVAATQPITVRGIVYIFRRGANIFSTGMDEVAEKLQARGVDAKSVGHAS